MNVYFGVRFPTVGCRVWWADERGYARPLCRCLHVRNHSPDGFEWGYGGSGPAQLALALVYHATGDRRLAERMHQSFKFRVVGRMAGDMWILTQAEVLEAVGELIAEEQHPSAAELTQADRERGDGHGS